MQLNCKNSLAAWFFWGVGFPAGEHWIDPVLYVGLSRTSGADKSLKEAVGFDGQDDLLAPNGETALERKTRAKGKDKPTV